MTFTNRLLSVLLVLLVFSPSPGWANTNLQPITLQLRWMHQFQFAGYIMAKEKGFYQQQGLDVEIRPGGPGIASVTEVLHGQAQYGVGNMEVLSLYQQGEPLIALATIYQHSPSILLVRQDSQIYTVKDLKGKRVMLFAGQNDPELLGMILSQGLKPNDIERIETSADINDLITGKTDAFNAYLTNEPFLMQEQGVRVRIINPRNYGINFYSDVLFTTQSELNNHPARAEAFRQASLKGWYYALNHPEETIQVLVDKYQVKKSLNHLRYESNMVREMVMPDMVELGYMSEVRWQQMAEQLKQLGIISKIRSLDNFIYLPESRFDWQRWALWIVAGICFLVVLFSLILRLSLINRKLEYEVEQRKKAEIHARHLSLHDHLTGLPNRLLLMDRLDMLCKRTLRDANHPVLLFIDLDGFKEVNDTCGHDAGDKLLCTVAQRLKSELRETDTIARLGGDEFVVLLENTTTSAEVQKIVDNLLRALSLPSCCLEQHSPVTASIGMARIELGDTPSTVLKKADRAMYHIKKSGKDGCADYHQLPVTSPSP